MRDEQGWVNLTIDVLRKIPALAGASAVLLFFLPWVLVSCSGARGIQVEASGYEIASGNYNELDALSDLGSLFDSSADAAASEGAEPLLWLIPLMGLGGLAALSGNKDGSQLAMLAGILGVIGLAVFGVNASSAGDEIAMAGFQLEFRYGYWFSWLAFMLQAGAAWMLGREGLTSNAGGFASGQGSPAATPVPVGSGVLARLEIVGGPSRGTVVEISKADFLIGRSSTCDLLLRDSAVSRQHARLRYAGGAWFIQDQGSSAGTMVNGQRIQAGRVEFGDAIGIGDSTLVLNEG